jgi:hypothetical protein
MSATSLRAAPVWSVASAPEPAPMAGLPGSGMCVSVSPPLFASGASRASIGLAAVPTRLPLTPCAGRVPSQPSMMPNRLWLVCIGRPLTRYTSCPADDAWLPAMIVSAIVVVPNCGFAYAR